MNTNLRRTILIFGSLWLGHLCSAQLLRADHNYLWQGREDLKELHWLDALDKIREESPSSDSAYFQSLIHLKNGNRVNARDAIKLHERVRNHLYPYETKILLGLANSFTYYKAYGNFLDAIRLNPERVEGYIEKVKVLSDQKDYISGIDHANEAIRLFPDQNELYVFRGNLYVSEGLRKRAFKDFKRVIDAEIPLSDYYLAQAHRGLAWSYLGQDDLVQAEIHLLESLIISPDHPFSKGVLAELCFLKGDAKGAIAAFEEIVDVEIRKKYYLMMGLAHEELKQVGQACGYYEQCCQREISLACKKLKVLGCDN